MIAPNGTTCVERTAWEYQLASSRNTPRFAKLTNPAFSREST
jgi:hypothetical protein